MLLIPRLPPLCVSNPNEQHESALPRSSHNEAYAVVTAADINGLAHYGSKSVPIRVAPINR